MKRSDAIQFMRIAGYHDDSKRFTRLLIENRVARDVADNAWQLGKKQKAGGMPCGCQSCIGHQPIRRFVGYRVKGREPDQDED